MDKNPKDNRCFVIMPFSGTSDYEEDHFTKIYNQIFIPAIKKAGFEPYRADDNKICDSIIDKIFEGVQNCSMALCDLSSKNPNVLYELGLRQAYDMPVVLVQDEKTERIFDVSGISTVSYNSHRLVENVEKAIEDIAEVLIQTKEGKDATLAKIVKAKAADFSQVHVGEQENIGIILKSIMSDLKELKKDRENDQMVNDYRYSSSNIILNNNNPKRCCNYLIYKKDGITKRQVLEKIRTTASYTSADIEMVKFGEEIGLRCSFETPGQMLCTESMIKSSIGEIKSKNEIFIPKVF